MEQLKLHVVGMRCAACEQRIQRALAELHGVIRSAADHHAAQVTVVFDPAHVSPKTVQDRIKQAGYEVAT
jgi:Cu+-exporting ATPase